VRLVLAIALAAVAALALLLWVHRQQERALVQATGREALRLAEVAAADYGRVVDSTELLLAIMARLPEVRRGSPEACAAVLSDLRESLPAYANLGVARPDGQVWCSAIPSGENLQASDRSWFQRAVTHRQFAAGEYQVGRATKKESLNFALPLEGPDGALDGVVFAALDLSYLSGDGRLPVSGASLTLVDDQGIVLARHPDGEAWVGRPASEQELVKRLLAGEQGTHRLRGLRGEPRIFAFVPVRPAEGMNLWLALGLSEEVVLDQARQVAGVSVLGLLALALLTLGATWLSSGWAVVRRIDRLRLQALQLSRGDLSARSALRHGPDELGQLAAAFDNMAAQLETAVRARDDFLSIASHELKTPLTSLGLNLQLMAKELERGAEDKAKERLAGALRQIDRVSRLMSTLLEVRRLSDERLRLRPEPLDLCELVRDVVDRMQAQTNAEGTPLVFTHCPSAHGTWDPLRLDQAVSNLVSNAVKYGQGKPVEVSVAPSPLGFCVGVKDHGVGIAAEDQGRLFQRFERARSARGFAGIGLGLYVTKEIVAAHGGEIRVHSAPGEGATFEVDLPVHAPVARGGGEPEGATPPASTSGGR
jgi:signal transduction histidine kinase